MDNLILIPYKIYENNDFITYFKPNSWKVDIDKSIDYDLRNFTMEEILTDIRKNKPSFQIFVGLQLQQCGVECSPTDKNFFTAQRYDLDTSGCILVAKSMENFQLMRETVNDKKNTMKVYLCLVNGELKENEGFIKKRINCTKQQTKAGKQYMMCSNSNTEGNPACSFFSKVATFKDKDDKYYTLVQVRIYTGRTHQIRIHMKSIGHPLVMDRKYLPQEVYEKNNEICSRLFLHNFFLKINWKGTEHAFRNALPLDLIACLSRLEMVELLKQDFYTLSDSIYQTCDMGNNKYSKNNKNSN